MRAHLLVLAALLAFARPAAAQLGVSDDRVSLPQGPGSREGVGENVTVDGNMATMRYSVPITLPQGFAGATPSLALSYDSGAGSSMVGVGWSLAHPTIERMTYRRLPKYALDDDFAADGGQQLVLLPGSSPPTYRARFEGSFVRYTWLEAGQGQEGYWKAEYPDGRVGWFGATAGGALVAQAREGADQGTFRYHLVEQQDVFGHSVRYSHIKSGNVSLVSSIGYVYTDGVSPRYRVDFTYEPAADATGKSTLSDAKAGFEWRLQQRLAAIHVFSGPSQIRRYELGYEPYADSGGFTRLSRVRMVGQDGTPYPAAFDFTYSKALGGVCQDAGCQKPLLVAMGSTGVAIETGRATLLDLNGDSLPDLVSTPVDANHAIYASVPAEDGTTTFAPPVTSALGTSAYALGSGVNQALDVDGDGFCDLLNMKTGTYLKNQGQGDWSEVATIGQDLGSSLPSFESDFDLSQDHDLRTIRFVDVDNDRRIDILRATKQATELFRNQGALGFALDTDVDEVGETFDGTTLDLKDMNGDGLLDLVQLFPGELRYRLSLGYGHWTGWTSIEDVPVTAGNLTLARLEDINGDSLADLVIVTDGALQYALNRAGEELLPTQTLTSADVDGGSLPSLVNTTILFADMNGNGSEDVVWVTHTGTITYLELFPVRPNLLSRIENGLGHVTEVAYATSVVNMAKDGGAQAWKNRLPHPMIVVARTDEWDALTDVHEVVDYRYRDGYYDGAEKQYRGYAGVDVSEAGDATQEAGLVRAQYDVGDTDRYRKGLLLRRTSGSATVVLREETHTYTDCPVAEVPAGTELAVRHLCETETVVVHRDTAPESAAVTTKTTRELDGYGNVIRASELGVVTVGGKGCAPCARPDDAFGAPCGAACTGDERTVETAFVPPSQTGGRWILHAPSRETQYGAPGSPTVSETVTYYDGPAHVGLPEGELTHGLATRVSRRVDDTVFIDSQRSAYDADGQVVETLDPLGVPGGNAHRRLYTYDTDHLRVVRVEALVGAYALRQEVQYEPLFDRPVESTAWMRVEGGETNSPRRSTFYAYDEFGRIVSMVKPGGDTAASPTETYEYELKAPVSREIVRRRSAVGGPIDLATLRCLDGRGRVAQERTRLGEGSYQISGFTVYNKRGQPVRVYQPHLGTTDACDTAEPTAVRRQDLTYDALHRPAGVTEPDAELYGAATTRRRTYEPLATWVYDGEDTDPQSPHYDTPTVTRLDGLGRVVSLERRLAGGAPEVVTVTYDALGFLRSTVDPGGNEKVQRFDRLGRVTEVDDPNCTAPETWTWDAASNEVEHKDARGVVVTSEYDGLNRLVARFDAKDAAATRIEQAWDAAKGCDAATCTNTEGLLVETRVPLAGLSAGAVERRGYDVRGRVAGGSLALAGPTYAWSHAYDNADRVVATTYPNGRTVERTYDAASRLTVIAGVVTSVTWDERGLPSTQANADGTAEERVFDARMRLARLVTKGKDGGALQGFEYTRDREGHLAQIHDVAGASDASRSPEAAFGYDAYYRVTTAALGPKDAAETLTTAFDSLDDIVSVESSRGASSPAHRGAYVYGGAGPNAVTSAGGLALGYDAAGRETARGDLMFTWDFLGRMTAARRGDAPVMEAWYGAGADRLIRREGDAESHYVTSDFVVRDGVASVWVRVGKDRVARFDDAGFAAQVLPDLAPDGAIRANDAWLATTADAGRILQSAARRMTLDEGDEPTFIHHDHLGSATLATRGGALAGAQAFYPMGGARGAPSGFVDDYGFTGQERDATGLVRFAHRYLDVELGRWTAPDPAFKVATARAVGHLGEASTAYAYVANDFANAVDPTGLKKAASEAATIRKSAEYKALAAQHKELGQRITEANILGAIAGRIAHLTKHGEVAQMRDAFRRTEQRLGMRSVDVQRRLDRLIPGEALRLNAAHLNANAAHERIRGFAAELHARHREAIAAGEAREARRADPSWIGHYVPGAGIRGVPDPNAQFSTTSAAAPRAGASQNHYIFSEQASHVYDFVDTAQGQ